MEFKIAAYTLKSWLHINLLTFVTLGFYTGLHRLLICFQPVISSNPVHEYRVWSALFRLLVSGHPRYGVRSLPLSKLLLHGLPLNVGLNLTSANYSMT